MWHSVVCMPSHNLLLLQRHARHPVSTNKLQGCSVISSRQLSEALRSSATDIPSLDDVFKPTPQKPYKAAYRSESTKRAPKDKLLTGIAEADLLPDISLDDILSGILPHKHDTTNDSATPSSLTFPPPKPDQGNSSLSKSARRPWEGAASQEQGAKQAYTQETGEKTSRGQGSKKAPRKRGRKPAEQHQLEFSNLERHPLSVAELGAPTQQQQLPEATASNVPQPADDRSICLETRAFGSSTAPDTPTSTISLPLQFSMSLGTSASSPQATQDSEDVVASNIGSLLQTVHVADGSTRAQKRHVQNMHLAETSSTWQVHHGTLQQSPNFQQAHSTKASSPASTKGAAFVGSTRARRSVRAADKVRQFKNASVDELLLPAAPGLLPTDAQLDADPEAWELSLLSPHADRQATSYSQLPTASVSATASPVPKSKKQLEPIILPEVQIPSKVPLLSISELPAQVDSLNWQLHANARFPGIFEEDWHQHVYEFLFDLWPAVGKAHKRQHKEMYLEAYKFANLCYQSRDTAIRSAVVVSFVENACDYEGVFSDSLPHLSKDMLLTAVTPLMRVFQPLDASDFLMGVREHYPEYKPKPAAGWIRKLVARLRHLQTVHPATPITCLLLMADDCT